MCMKRIPINASNVDDVIGKKCYVIGAIQVLRNAIFLQIGPPPTPS